MDGSGGAGGSAAADASVFDPDLFPSLLPRVHELAALLVQASRDPHSLEERDTDADAQGDGQEQDAAGAASAAAQPAAASTSSAPLPSFVLGATAEDEMVNSWDDYAHMSTGKRSRTRPTELQKCIVREAQALKDALAGARAAVQQLPGGALSLKRQREVIQMLEQQEIRQSEMEASFVANSGFVKSDQMETT